MGAEQLLKARKRVEAPKQTAADLKSQLRAHLRAHPELTYAELLDDAWDFRIRATWRSKPGGFNQPDVDIPGPTKDKDVEWKSWDVPEICYRLMLEPQALALLNAADLAAAMGILERLAGHFTLLKFSKGWKAVFGTPWLGASEEQNSDYEKILRLPTADTPLAAIRLAAARELSEQSSETRVEF